MIKRLTKKEIAEFPGGLRKLEGWCTEVWESNFDRSKYEIVETDDGPYAFCTECAAQLRAQLAYLEETGKLPSA